jgi:hypothetical protein
VHRDVLDPFSELQTRAELNRTRDALGEDARPESVAIRLLEVSGPVDRAGGAIQHAAQGTVVGSHRRIEVRLMSFRGLLPSLPSPRRAAFSSPRMAARPGRKRSRTMRPLESSTLRPIRTIRVSCMYRCTFRRPGLRRVTLSRQATRPTLFSTGRRTKAPHGPCYTRAGCRRRIVTGLGSVWLPA